jgi:hypothetical protein
VNDGIKVSWNPDDEARKICFSFGKDFAARVKG